MTSPSPGADDERTRISDDMLFVVSTTGDGCNSVLVRGRIELGSTVLAALWMGTIDDAPEDVIATLNSLDDPGEWSGGYYPDRDPFWLWYRDYEDGHISVQRVLSCPAFNAARQASSPFLNAPPRRASDQALQIAVKALQMILKYRTPFDVESVARSHLRDIEGLIPGITTGDKP